MNLEDSTAKTMYKIYNFLGIRYFPSWLLDLFLPFICYKTSIIDIIFELWLNNRGFIVKPDVMK